MWIVGILVLLMSACSQPRTQPPSQVHVEPHLERSSYVTSDGYRLPFRHYVPPHRAKAMVVALHGFNDYSIAFDGMCKAFVTHRIECIAYDQRGFGETRLRGLWPPEGRLQIDLKEWVGVLSDSRPGVPIFLVGESMGGAVILTALSRDASYWQEHIAGVILMAPAVWARETQPWYLRWSLWLAVRTFPDWKPTGQGLGVVASDNIEALRAMRRDPLVIKATRIDTVFGLTNLMDEALASSDRLPVDGLVLYGAKDEVIPKSPICKMLGRMPTGAGQTDFIYYPNGYHMLTRDLQAESVFRDSAEWMLKTRTTDESHLNQACSSNEQG
uniref:Lysophospholipase, alpha-beta hydrolase superfamily n=1 Tax=Candidatus Kentrum sp. FW TaxID=2126338 RepID=A0A450U1S9_9GAMM|nr:MAG: Lysophospholipase, alpha-beta hydrolase superfamily [Candidatus Kentron sp. FW]